MDPFEYVIVLTSLILGLGITQILVGVADMITNKNIKWSLPHTILTLLIFLYLIQDWWVTYTYSMLVMAWTLPLVMIMMVYPIVLFVAARVLFPHERMQNDPVDMEEYYWKKWPVLFTILLIVALTSLAENYLFQGIPVIEQFVPISLIVVYSVFLIVNIKNRILHIVFMSLQLIGFIIYVMQLEYKIGG